MPAIHDLATTLSSAMDPEANPRNRLDGLRSLIATLEGEAKEQEQRLTKHEPGGVIVSSNLRSGTPWSVWLARKADAWSGTFLNTLEFFIDDLLSDNEGVEFAAHLEERAEVVTGWFVAFDGSVLTLADGEKLDLSDVDTFVI